MTTVRMDRDAKERVIDRLGTLLASREELSFAFAFGSCLTRDRFHDVDVGIWTTPSAPPDVDVALAVELSDALGLPVDVRRVNEAPTAFLFHVLQGRLLAANDEPLLADLMERTARDYHDRAPLVERAARDAFTP